MNYVVFLARPLAYFIGLYSLYFFKGYYSNEYMGYEQLSFDLFSIFGVLISIIHYLFFFRKVSLRPSDFFIFFYSIIVFFPYVIFNGVWGRVGFSYLFDLAILYLPILGVIGMRVLRVKFPEIYFLRENVGLYILILCALLVVFYLIRNAPESASFSLLDSYTRRLEARVEYGSGTLIAYASAIVMNGVLPLLAFLGVVRRNIILILFPMVLFVVFYYVYGVKAPLLYIFLSYALGIFLTYSSLDSFIKSIFTLLVLVFIIAWLEFMLTEYSYLEDYLIRRVYYVSSYIVGAYLELFDSEDFSRFTGLGEIGSASMYVGETFLGKEGLNANTNTFLYFLIQYGILGYFLSIVFVGIVFSFFDSLYKKNKIFIYLSFIYTLLILEQSAATALLTSGVGVLAIVFLFLKPELYQGD